MVMVAYIKNSYSKEVLFVMQCLVKIAMVDQLYHWEKKMALL